MNRLISKYIYNMRYEGSGHGSEVDLAMDLDLDLDLDLARDWSSDRPQESLTYRYTGLEALPVASNHLRLARPRIG